MMGMTPIASATVAGSDVKMPTSGRRSAYVAAAAPEPISAVRPAATRNTSRAPGASPEPSALATRVDVALPRELRGEGLWV